MVGKRSNRNKIDMSEIELKIIDILGRSAFDNDMQVPYDVRQLAQATRYLALQLQLLCRNEVGDEDVALPILEKAAEILN